MRALISCLIDSLEYSFDFSICVGQSRIQPAYLREHGYRDWSSQSMLIQPDCLPVDSLDPIPFDGVAMSP